MSRWGTPQSESRIAATTKSIRQRHKADMPGESRKALDLYAQRRVGNPLTAARRDESPEQ